MNKSKVLHRELNHILIMLDNYKKTNKSIILGKLYISYLEEKFDWDKFQEFSYILERIFIKDLNLLAEIVESEGILLKDVIDKSSLYRLNSVGLINREEPIKKQGDMFLVYAGVITSKDYVSNNIGEEFYYFGVK
jgi:hypothetical protein